jgi:hypothetical protein
MALSGADHQAVQRATMDARNAAARASRVRVSETTILEATDPAGTRYTLALSQKEGWRAYLVWAHPKLGGLACGCPAFVWRKSCSHTEAYAEIGPPGGPGAPPPMPTRRR